MTGARSHGAPRQMFSDARTAQRFLRVSWHPAEKLVTLSVWGSDECLATFRLPTDEVPELISVLARGLATDSSVPSDALPRTGALSVAPEPARPTAEQPEPRALTPRAPGAAATPSSSRRTALRALDLLVARAADVLRAQLDRLDPDGKKDQM